jgi:hypothetical protein
VFRINGAYNALAVEMADHIVLFEPGPSNLARARAVIAETKRSSRASPFATASSRTITWITPRDSQKWWRKASRS